MGGTTFFDLRLKEWWSGYDLWVQDTTNIKKRVPGHNKAKKIDWYDRPAAGIRACDFGIQTVWTSPYGQEILNKVKDRFEPKPEIGQLSDDDLAKKMAALQWEIDRIQKIERTINNEPAQIIIVCVPVKDRENYPKVETAEGPHVGTAGQTMKSVFITEEDNDLRYSKNSVRALYDYIHQEFLRRRSITEEPALNDRTEGQ